MSEVDPRQATGGVDAPLHRAPDYRVIYCNSSRMARSPWDLRIVLGKTVEVARNEFDDEDTLTVITAPGHAKAFLRSLLATIDEYEQHFGAIHDPLPALRAADKVIGDAQRAARSESDSKHAASATADSTLRRSDGYAVIYCNASRMAKSPWDVRFVLGKTIELTRNEFVIEDRVTVIMAPGHAKAFSRALAGTIDTYEQTYGKINDPLTAARPADKAIGAAQHATRPEGPSKDPDPQSGTPARGKPT